MVATITDFGSIGTAIAMIVIACMQFLEKWKSSKRDKDLAALKATTDAVAVKRDKELADLKAIADATAVKVEEVHKLTDGNMGAQLKIAMTSALTLASVTTKPEHVLLAKVASEKFAAHEKTMAQTTVVKPTPPKVEPVPNEVG